MQVDDANETSARCAENVRRLAEDAFAEHNIVPARFGGVVLQGEWLCRRPRSSAYHFTVIARPNVLIVYGDIGDWILSMSNADPVAWAARAVRSPGYFFEKVCAASVGGRDAFYPADLRAWLRERMAGCPDDSEGAQRCRDALEELDDREADYYMSHEVAMDVLSQRGFDDVGHLGVAPSGRSYWLLEAMRWFTTKVPVWLQPTREEVAGG